MNVVQPIRSKRKITAMKNALSPRDRLLFVIGVNSALRVSDLLSLKVKDVRGRDFITLNEKKTRKAKRFKINASIKREVNRYLASGDFGDDEYLFRSPRANKPISRVAAWKNLNKAAAAVGLEEVGTHTLRKTFGYWAHKSGVPITVIQKAFNHTHPAITQRYLGITQDDVDDVYDLVQL
ncbi:site-specific integrase [Paludifilum halophilum]|uniref:Site-specific integrase n=1 Tax=Paludifilum halophilum TaxID=1642702 RepID=A0A235B8B5_9BACL|nr:site-specific integrase [Paludifilum halophilum]OYD08534.1 site-specific integrase [Paludifilum halophilum]